MGRGSRTCTTRGKLTSACLPIRWDMGMHHRWEAGKQPMHDIDFLPSEYRQNHHRRRSQTRRILVVAVLAAALAAAALDQHRRRQQLRAALADREPAHAAAVQKRDALDELQSRLQAARARADLFTYLRHPWPRTQIMGALLGPLPDEIAFEQVEIAQETATASKPARNLSPADEQAREEQLAGLSAAARDLRRLRDEFDPKRTTVTITGVTSESAALHRYLRELGRAELFSKAQLNSIETDKADPNRVRFTVTLLVRPGYGQPGGPDGPAPQPTAQTAGNTT